MSCWEAGRAGLPLHCSWIAPLPPVQAGGRTAASAEMAGQGAGRDAGYVPASPGCIYPHSLAPCLLQRRRFEAAHL